MAAKSEVKIKSFFSLAINPLQWIHFTDNFFICIVFVKLILFYLIFGVIVDNINVKQP